MKSDPFINQLKIFISQEPSAANIKITPSRTEEFIFYLTTLKKMTGNLLVNQNKDIRAYQQYCLGELYAKCPYTFLAYKKSRSLDQCTDENALHLLRMKAAVIHYLNALVEANKSHGNKKNRNLIINCLRHLKILPRLPLDNRLKIMKQTILTLTELLNQQPITNTAIDELYDKAKFALEDYIILAKKEFLGRFNGDKEIEAMLIKYYRNTIFEKMAVDVANEVNRLNSKRQN